MTEEEKAMFKSDDYENKMFAAPVIRTRVGPDGKIISYTARVEQGVKITVKSKTDNTAAAQAQSHSATQGDV